MWYTRLFWWKEKFCISERPCNFIFITDINTYEILNHFTLKKPKGAIFLCNHSNSDLFTCETIMFFSRAKISCFRPKDHLIFHWCIYYKYTYRLSATSMAPNKNSHIFIYPFSYKVNVLFKILNTLMVQGYCIQLHDAFLDFLTGWGTTWEQWR